MRHVLPMLMAAALGVALSLTAWSVVSHWEDRAAEKELSEIIQRRVNIVQHGIDEYLSKLIALRALFESSDREVSRNEFEAFAGRLLQGQTAIQSMSWIPRVTREERPAVEAAARADGLTGYHIKFVAGNNQLLPALEHDEYFPIYYSTEKPRTSPVYGIDLRSEPMRRRTLERSRDADVIAASENFQLHTGTGNRYGFFLVLPVYRRGLAHDGEEERQRHLIGFVQGAFQTAVMIDTILLKSTLPRGLDHYLFAAGADANALPISVHESRLRTGPAEAKPLGALTAGPHWTDTLKAGDGRWTLVTVATPVALVDGSHARAWTVLIAGLLLSAAVAASMWSSARYALRLLQANEQISALAQKDALTDLANRRAFFDRLTACFAACGRGASPFAVLYFDLDHFKDVNDTLGHPAGDELLRQVARRLEGLVRASDLVARFGGDEFAVLQTEVGEATAAGTLAAKIVDTLAAPYRIGTNEVRVTASLGISFYSAELAGPEAVMIQADLALYRAKEDGRNCYRFHSGNLDLEVRERVSVGDELHLALGRGELELHYQPQVEIASGRVVGLEALVRWNHPTRGLVLPSVFIPIAERMGTIVPLGQWVFEEACRQMKLWADEGIAPQVVAVNFSAAQCKRSEVDRTIADSLTRWGIRPGAMEVELTESVLMDVAENNNDVLDRLRQLGVRLAIDDFGTGYSSLRYLTIYNVYRLKIAQELIFGVTSDSRNATVVRTAIRLARDLGLECVAEGVETAAQATFLVAAGCVYAQGYYFSRPLNREQTTELLRRRTVSAPAPHRAGELMIAS
ncbi:MAG: EAL domain-containing protein [Bradyrhizobium sp.]